MALLMKEAVQGVHNLMAAAGPRFITSADAISVLFTEMKTIDGVSGEA